MALLDTVGLGALEGLWGHLGVLQGCVAVGRPVLKGVTLLAKSPIAWLSPVEAVSGVAAAAAPLFFEEQQVDPLQEPHNAIDRLAAEAGPRAHRPRVELQPPVMVRMAIEIEEDLKR